MRPIYDSLMRTQMYYWSYRSQEAIVGQRKSGWKLMANVLLVLFVESNPDFKMVPKSCCYRKLDYLTRQLTNKYEDLGRCQNWQYGPPKFVGGAHNDAIYYRVCYRLFIMLHRSLGMLPHHEGIHFSLQFLDCRIWNIHATIFSKTLNIIITLDMFPRRRYSNPGAHQHIVRNSSNNLRSPEDNPNWWSINALKLSQSLQLGPF